jgi:hypothetical protein
MKSPHPARLCLAATLALACLTPRDATADNTRTSAQALFDEAMKQMDEREYDRACPNLEEVEKLMPGKVGALLELARCYEEWGKTASAWRRYRTAAALAARLFDPREANASAKVDQLTPRLPRLLVAVAPANRAIQDLTVQLDGRNLSAAEQATALPVDPGRHLVIASASGKKSWTGSIAVWPGARTVSIRIPLLEDASDPHAPPAPTKPLPAQDAPAGESAPVWPWIAGSLGVLWLSIGMSFGVDGLSASDELERMCHGHLSPCAGHTASDISPLNGRKDRGLGMFVGFGPAGVAGVAAGLVGLLNRPKTTTALIVTPAVGPGFAGLGIGSRF